MSHIHEKIDFTASCLIVYKNRVLLRIHDKYKIWLGVGGHIELDEDPNQAAIREAREEVGLDVMLYSNSVSPGDNNDKHQELIPPRFMNRHVISVTHEHIDLVYIATSESDQVVAGENEQIGNCRWFSRAELDDPEYAISPIVRYYAKTALEEAGSK